ncbi:hypothetical protein TYRP_022259 [Tyrophagus putrescentiae]|nr:hypothetical protein TYRP_022259 [Tyrophagus putrescentiae]
MHNSQWHMDQAISSTEKDANRASHPAGFGPPAVGTEYMILENVPSTVNFQAPRHNSDGVEEMAASSDPLYKCDQCTSAFVDLNSLKEHQSQVHGSVLGPLNITTGLPIATHNEGPIFECPTCGKSFHRKDNLRQHEKIHLTVKPFPCNQCTKSLKDHQSWIYHLPLVNSNSGQNKVKTAVASSSSIEDTSTATLQPPLEIREEDQFSILNRAIVDDVHCVFDQRPTASTKNILNLMKAFPGSAVPPVHPQDRRSGRAKRGTLPDGRPSCFPPPLCQPATGPQPLPLATEEKKYSLGYADILQLKKSIEWPNDGGG